jgi:hypothetical protein
MKMQESSLNQQIAMLKPMKIGSGMVVGVNIAKVGNK